MAQYEQYHLPLNSLYIVILNKFLIKLLIIIGFLNCKNVYRGQEVLSFFNY